MFDVMEKGSVKADLVCILCMHVAFFGTGLIL